jgi:hypothetical protein
LPVTWAEQDGRSVALLGYVLDPHEPTATDADVVHRLLRWMESDRSREAFIRQTFAFGGRWILVVDDGSDVWLFNDPCGYRQVYHTHGSPHGFWCASQPGLLAETLHLAPDGEASRFIDAQQKRHPQYWWPSDTSPYKEVRHLVPNHYLDAGTGMAHRFWPEGDIAPRTLEEVVEENARLLQRLIESAAYRYELALSITAGGDTRLLLAGSRSIRDRLYCFTTLHWDLDRTSPDIRIPSQLLPRLGLQHHVIPCPPSMEREFKSIYDRNVSAAREAYGTIAQGFFNHYPGAKVAMMGNAVPIARNHFRTDLRRRRPEADGHAIEPRTLAWLTNRPEEFALRAFGRWLSDVPPMNLDVLTLFCWEDHEGGWAAMSQLEWDIVQEEFVPYNSRQFLTNMLSVPELYRARTSTARSPNVLWDMLMLRLWPEVLCEPVNPAQHRTAASTARQFFRRPGCRNWGWVQSHLVAPHWPPFTKK